MVEWRRSTGTTDREQERQRMGGRMRARARESKQQSESAWEWVQVECRRAGTGAGEGEGEVKGRGAASAGKGEAASAGQGEAREWKRAPDLRGRRGVERGRGRKKAAVQAMAHPHVSSTLSINLSRAVSSTRHSSRYSLGPSGHLSLTRSSCLPFAHPACLLE